MKKGFTLIELLAVITLLGIISIITAPLIGSVIEKSKMGAFEDSVYGIVDAVNLDKAENGFNVNKVYTISGGTISPNLQTKGSINGTGTVKLDEDGNIYLSIQFDKWCATKEYENKQVIVRVETCIPNSDSSIANVPYLLSNMIAVRWDGTKWVKADRRNPVSAQWYNYGTTAGTRLWANAVVVKDVGTKIRDYYLSDAAIGNEVAEADILAYFVWIPRFNYAIPAGAGARTINIAFESGLPDPLTGDGITTYKTHPAFTLGDRNLTGFWFGKFETTGTLTDMTIKPSIAALASNAIINIYDKVSELAFTDNVYGFATAKTDIRLAKNSEWGAVTYLTNSLYGKNATLYKNPSTTYITGCAGATATAAGAVGCSNYYTSTNGVHASTTDNVYGIYDMAGGTSDLVFGNYKEYPGQSGFNMFPDAKYFDKYTTTTATTACNGGICYGQALSETSAWYSGTANFVTSTNPWIIRGSNSGVNIASQYAYDYYGGAASTSVGYRLSLSNK